MRFVIGGMLVVGVALGFGCARTPYQLKKDAQARQAAELRPAELQHDASSWRALRSLRMRLYLSVKGDLALQRREFEERLVRANQVLESALRVRLVLEDVRELALAQPGSADTEATLRELEQRDPGQDVDVVVALIEASPIVTLSFHELGRARVLGKHMVVRTMDDVAELRALETFDTLDQEERSRLYQQRKRHKETSVLLHELGHVLGALHTRDRLELMHPAHDNAMSGFAAANLELMKVVVDARLSDPARSDEPALYRRLSDLLERIQWTGWVAEEHRFALAELRRGGQSQAQPASAAAAASPAAGAAPTVAAAAAKPEPDLGALSEADRERYRALDRQTAAEQWREAFESASQLAASYPDSLPVQQKTCEIGMQLGVARKQIKPYCDRMMKLATGR